MLPAVNILTFGIIALVISLLLLAGGIALLTILTKKKGSGRKRVGGLVCGGIMIAVGLLAVFYFASMLIIYKATTAVITNADAMIMKTELGNSVAMFDKKGLIDLFAEESYDGDPIDPEEAEEFFGLFGDKGGVWYYDDYSGELTMHDDIQSTTYVYSVTCFGLDDRQLTVYFDCITQASDKSLIGIQHIAVEQDDVIIREFGTEPEYD